MTCVEMAALTSAELAALGRDSTADRALLRRRERARVRYLFVDVRFDLVDADAGARMYREGHIPGAVFLDLHRDLSAPAAPALGRHPLPSADAFAAVASRAGIGPGTFVVAYDDAQNRGAARLWWLLRHFGHADVAVLDGGVEAWSGPLESGWTDPEPATFVAREREDDVVTAAELAARIGDPGLVVFDARPPDRYSGRVAGLDPVAGRVPGAVSWPHTERRVPAAASGAREIAVYCGSGITACVDLLALARAGREDARLYPGSWSQWSQLGLPLERDDEAGGPDGPQRRPRRG